MAFAFQRPEALKSKKVYFLFFVLILLVSIINPAIPKAAAASVYDDAYQTTPAIYVQDGSCNSVALTLPQLDSLMERDLTSTQMDYVDEANNAYQVVTQMHATGSRGSSDTETPAIVRGTFSYDATEAYLIWQDWGSYQRILVAPTDGDHITVEFKQNTTTCDPYADFVSLGAGTQSVSESYDVYDFPAKNLLINGNVQLNIPVDYEGDDIVTEVTDIDEIVYPHVTYNVQDKTIDLQYQQNIDFEGTYECELITYKFFNEYGDEVNMQQTGFDKPTDDIVSYEYSDYGTKTVSVKWDNLSNAGCPDIDHIVRSTSIIEIELDGYSKSGDNFSGDNCDYIGTCSVPTEIEDCSVYNPITDMGEFVVCSIKNFIALTKSWFIQLFVPRGTFFQDKLDEANEYAKDRASLLVYPATWYASTTNGMISQSGDCDLAFSGFYNSSANWDLCQVETRFPSVWSLATTLARIMLIMSLFFGLYMFYIRTWTHS